MASEEKDFFSSSLNEVMNDKLMEKQRSFHQHALEAFRAVRERQGKSPPIDIQESNYIHAIETILTMYSKNDRDADETLYCLLNMNQMRLLLYISDEYRISFAHHFITAP